MKKTGALLLAAVLLAALMSVFAGAKDNSVWLVDKDTVITVPADLLNGYSAISQNTLEATPKGYAYLHFKMHFSEKTKFEHPKLWAYVVLGDNADSPTAVNANTFNLTATTEYKEGWNDVVIPFTGFVKYEGKEDNALIGDWTDSIRWFRFVTVGADCPEIQIKDLYLSVNENDPSPADKPTPPSPDTGTLLTLAIAASAVIPAGMAVIKSKKHR